MATEIKKDIQLEIGHVLFIYIVGYSKLLTNEQRELLRRLNEIIRATDEFRVADSSGKLLRLPEETGWRWHSLLVRMRPCVAHCNCRGAEEPD